jgi:hypothetical protein
MPCLGSGYRATRGFDEQALSFREPYECSMRGVARLRQSHHQFSVEEKRPRPTASAIGAATVTRVTMSNPMKEIVFMVLAL